MKLLCVTDIHGDQKKLRQILQHAGKIDGILLGGDLTNFGTPNQAESLISVAREHNENVMAVAGNCDSPDIDERLTQLGVSLFGRGVIQADTGFYGASAMPPWLGNMYELTEDQIREALDRGADQVGTTPRHVVLSHTPPQHCRLDLTRQGEHVGSSALKDFIQRRQPALVVCGHIHEARGMERIGQTEVVNCGTAFQGFYAIAVLDSEVHVELQQTGIP